MEAIDDMNENGKAGFLDRTLNNLRNAWRAFAGSAYDESTSRPDLSEADTAALLKQMHACLDSQGGEVSARARAAALGRAYLALDATGRKRFLELLASEFDVDHTAVDRAVDALRGARDETARKPPRTACARRWCRPGSSSRRASTPFPRGSSSSWTCAPN